MATPRRSKRQMPETIPDSPENIAATLMVTPKTAEWRHLDEAEPIEEIPHDPAEIDGWQLRD
ncbi:MAG: hypothetical protein F4091_06975 [Acidimicrobiales bacterium]|nr:hypothetical protein [Acidimicrobiales bacterium]MYJ65190.1 hypothetical protein [Acidimicrobiales bacterium]